MQVEKKYLSLPLTAQLEITDYCNHRCVHCYNLYSEVQNRPSRKVGASQLLKPLYDGLQKEEDLQLDMNFDEFKQQFDQRFNNAQ